MLGSGLQPRQLSKAIYGLIPEHSFTPRIRNRASIEIVESRSDGNRVDQLHGMRRLCAELSSLMSAVPSPEVVHPEKDIGLPADYRYPGSPHKVHRDVRGSGAKPMVRLSAPVSS
jgi:hypothetical protein